MSSPQDRPWLDSERVFLLTEILRSSQIQPATVLRLIVETGVQISWENIPLPQGRSLNSCRRAYEDMFRSTQPYMAPRPPPIYAQPHFVPQPPMIQASRKRPYPESDPHFPPLQPKPSTRPLIGSPVVTNGDYNSPVRLSPNEPSVEQPKATKRGRPSKEMLRLREEEAAKEGRTYQPPAKRNPPKKPPKLTEQPSSATTSIPGGQAIIQTPRPQSPDPQDETSSGKRRKLRAQREQEEGSPSQPKPSNTFNQSSTVESSPSLERAIPRPPPTPTSETQINKDLPRTTPTLQNPGHSLSNILHDEPMTDVQMKDDRLGPSGPIYGAYHEPQSQAR